MRIRDNILLGITLASIAGVATSAAFASATINNTAGAVVGDTATAAPGARSGGIVHFAQNTKAAGSKARLQKRKAKRRSTKQKEPASNLGSNQQPVLCDCSNCSAQHCRSQGTLEYEWKVEKGEK